MACRKGIHNFTAKGYCKECHRLANRRFYYEVIKHDPVKWEKKHRRGVDWWRAISKDPLYRRLQRTRVTISAKRRAINNHLARVEKKEKELIKLIEKRDALLLLWNERKKIYAANIRRGSSVKSASA